MINWHHLLYGASRSGKTTLAAQTGGYCLAVTAEPQVTLGAFVAQGRDASSFAVWCPPTDEDLFLFLDYPTEYREKNLPSIPSPDLILFDNLQGLQLIVIGRPEQPERKAGDLTIPKQKATGIVGDVPKSSRDVEASNPEALSQAQYGVLGRRSRRLLNSIDSLSVNTIITATEQYDFDERYRKDAEGRSSKESAGRPREVKGYPATEGSMTKHFLAACVSGAFLHMVKDEKLGYLIHTKPHLDEQRVKWFADPRGLANGAQPPLNWTNKNGAELLKLA